MAKAINWPAPFRDEVLGENTEQLCCALRAGTLYFEGRFWAPNEEVDVRCGHLRVRRGTVVGDLELVKLADLKPCHYSALKQGLDNKEAVQRFFKTHYDTELSEDSELTIVFYKNLAIDPEQMDAPDPSERFV